jgi:acetylornithine deacetylase
MLALNQDTIPAAASAWLEASAGEMFDCLGQWVACNSTFPNELPLQRDLAEPFMREQLGLDEVARVNACAEADRPFVVGVWRGTGGGRNLLLNGHIDTIGAPGTMRDRWDTDPWQPIVKDGRLYGRGVSDMKAGVVAMLWAVRALKAAGFRPRGHVLLETVPGEETMRPDIGTVAATRWLQERGYQIPFAIVTEPTHLEIHVRGIGQMDFSIEVMGKEIHTSMRNLSLYPQRYGIPQGSAVAVDAIQKLTRILLLLEEMERQWAMRWRHPLHGGGGFPIHEDAQGVGTFSIVSTFIEGGTYEGSVPGWARVRGLINYPSWIDGDKVQGEFEGALRHHAQLDDWLREHPPLVKVGTVYDWPPFAGDHEAPGPMTLGQAYTRTTGKPAIFSGAKFVADAAFLRREFKIPAVYFGPGDCSMGVHGPNEFVPLQQVMDCAKVLAATIVDWCG